MESFDNYLSEDEQIPVQQAVKYFNNTIQSDAEVSRQFNELRAATIQNETTKKVVPQVLCEIRNTFTEIKSGEDNLLLINNELLIHIYYLANQEMFQGSEIGNDDASDRKNLLQITKNHDNEKKEIEEDVMKVQHDKQFLETTVAATNFGYPRKPKRIYFEAAKRWHKHDLETELKRLDGNDSEIVSTFLANLQNLKTVEMFRLFQQFYKLFPPDDYGINAPTWQWCCCSKLFVAAVKMCISLERGELLCQDIASSAGILHHLSIYQVSLTMKDTTDIYTTPLEDYIQNKLPIYNDIAKYGMKIYEFYKTDLTFFNDLEAVEHAIQHFPEDENQLVYLKRFIDKKLSNKIKVEYQQNQTEEEFHQQPQSDLDMFEKAMQLIQKYFANEANEKQYRIVVNYDQFGRKRTYRPPKTSQTRLPPKVARMNAGSQ